MKWLAEPIGAAYSTDQGCEPDATENRYPHALSRAVVADKRGSALASTVVLRPYGERSR